MSVRIVLICTSASISEILSGESAALVIDVFHIGILISYEHKLTVIIILVSDLMAVRIYYCTSVSCSIIFISHAPSIMIGHADHSA